MRRLGLILFCMALLFGSAQAEEFEECEDSKLFWTKLSFRGQAVAESNEQLNELQAYSIIRSAAISNCGKNTSTISTTNPLPTFDDHKDCLAWRMYEKFGSAWMLKETC